MKELPTSLARLVGLSPGGVLGVGEEFIPTKASIEFVEKIMGKYNNYMCIFLDAELMTLAPAIEKELQGIGVVPVFYPCDDDYAYRPVHGQGMSDDMLNAAKEIIERIIFQHVTGDDL